MGNCVSPPAPPSAIPRSLAATHARPQSRSSRGHSLSARYRSRLRRIRSTPSLNSQLAAFRIRSAFRKSRRLGSGRLAIPHIARAMRTDTPRVLRKPCLRGKSFDKSPASEMLSPLGLGARKPEVQRNSKAGNARPKAPLLVRRRASQRSITRPAVRRGVML